MRQHEKKDFLEWYVVEQTVEYVLMPDRMAAISKAVVELYNKEFNYDKIKELEKRIAKYERDIDKYTESLLDAPRAAYNKIFEKIEAADAAKCDLEIDLAKLKIANKIRYTEDDINIWLKSFCRGDLFDHEFRRRIIDVFINTIYLYDDKVVIYYNVKSGKQVSYIEMLDSIEDESEPEVSDSLNGVRIPNAVPPYLPVGYNDAKGHCAGFAVAFRRYSCKANLSYQVYNDLTALQAASM